MINQNLSDNNEYFRVDNDYRKTSVSHNTNNSNKESEAEEFMDELLYCFQCDEYFVGECEIHKSQWILNKRISCPYTLFKADNVFDDYYNENVDILNCYCKSNNIKHIKTTLPNGFFLIKSQVENTSYGVWTKNFVNKGTILGPFVGNMTCSDTIDYVKYDADESETNDFVWSLISTNNVGKCNLVDARDCMTANYLRFVRRARTDNEYNLAPIQFDGKIFYQAMKDISSSEELLVKYAIDTLCPHHLNDGITIRVISLNDQCWKNQTPSLDSNMNVQKTDNSDNNADSIKKFHNEKRFALTNGHIPKLRNYGFQPKVDDEMKSCLKEICTKYPSMTGTEANKMLKELLPSKPAVTNRTVLAIICRYGLRSTSSKTAPISPTTRQTRIKKFEPSLSENDQESTDYNVTETKRCKLTTEMIEFMQKLLRADPWMSVKDLIKSLRIAFPNMKVVTEQYLNQIISKRKLRPIKNARKKLDDEMKNYINKLYYQDGLLCSEISFKLYERFPNKPFITKKSVARVVAEGNARIKEDFSD